MKKLPIVLFAALSLTGICSNACNAGDPLPRVAILSDINNAGGDPDDKQSMAHLLMYANEVEIELIVPDYWKGKGVEATMQAMEAYEKDYLNPDYHFRKMNYPHPESLRERVARNREEALEQLISEALRADEGPLYVLIWGGMETLRDALNKEPAISENIRVLTIATNVMADNPDSRENADVEKYCEMNNWNGKGRDQIFDDPRFKELWWVENDWAYNGMFEGQEPRDFLLEVKQYGALGQHIWEVVQPKVWAHYFRAGDTPTLLYLLEATDHDDPAQSSWGGKFIRPFPEERPNYWIDDAGTDAWDYADPCKSWDLAGEAYRKRIDGLLESRPAMYEAFREKLRKIYGQETFKFYVGSGNGKLSHPIYLCELDPIARKMTVLDSFPAVGGAGYLSLSPDGKYLYTTSRHSLPGEEGNGSVASFRVLKDDRLEAINRQSSKGRGNCHVNSSPDGRHVFAANYGSGHATALPVKEGRLAEASSVVKGEGSGPIESRQEGPHAHQVVMDPAGRYLLVPDLGTDRVMNYVFDPETDQLSPNPKQPFLALPPGTGPRHLAFHPGGDYVYILGEMAATLTACSFNAKKGKLKIIASASIVEEGFDANRQSAAVRVHPNGHFVYASNRDDESNLAVFEIGEKGGITQTQIVKDIPYWPRDFNITPDGKFLISAGGRSNELALLSIDPKNGELTPTGAGLSLPGPICIVFIP